jgi:hypothetical protein
VIGRDVYDVCVVVHAWSSARGVDFGGPKWLRRVYVGACVFGIIWRRRRRRCAASARAAEGLQISKKLGHFPD